MSIAQLLRSLRSVSFSMRCLKLMSMIAGRRLSGRLHRRELLARLGVPAELFHANGPAEEDDETTGGTMSIAAVPDGSGDVTSWIFTAGCRESFTRGVGRVAGALGRGRGVEVCVGERGGSRPATARLRK